MGCCGSGRANGRSIKVNSGEYLDNFKFLTVKQLAKRGDYKYCYKCQKYHTKEEYENCNKDEINQSL